MRAARGALSACDLHAANGRPRCALLRSQGASKPASASSARHGSFAHACWRPLAAGCKRTRSLQQGV